MWSVLPTEPPPQETDSGSAFTLAIRSSRVLIGESTGTTTISYSPTRRATGVTWSRVTGALLVMIAPCRVWPASRTVSPLPFLVVTNWARPIVPPAPGTFWTWTLEASPASCSRPCMVRAV